MKPETFRISEEAECNEKSGFEFLLSLFCLNSYFPFDCNGC